MKWGKREVIIPVFPRGASTESLSELPFGVFFLLSCCWSLILAMIAAALRAKTSSADCCEQGSETQEGTVSKKRLKSLFTEQPLARCRPEAA